jgi:hypothetical protein
MARLVLYNIAKRNAEGLKEEYDDEEVTIDRDDTCPIDSDTLLMEARCTGEDGTSSALPTNVFYFESQDRGVFDGFCKEMDDKVLDNKEPQSWKVNAKGEQQKDSAKMRRTRQIRAYKKFCEDNDGKTLEDKTGLDRKYQRHAVSSYGVEDRASYWISASFIKGCEGKFTIKKDTCMDKFNKGLDSCDNGGFSHGYKAAEQCVEYAVDTGFELRDEGGPWNTNHMAPAYPPPEDIDEHKVV